MMFKRTAVSFFYLILAAVNTYGQSMNFSMLDTIPTTYEKVIFLSLKMERLIYTSTEQAVEVASKIKELAANEENEVIKGIALNTEGMSLFSQKKFDESVVKYLEALTLFDKLDSSRFMSKIYNNISGSYATSGDYQGAIDYLNKALQFYLKSNDVLWTAHTYNNLGIQYMNLKKYDESNEAFSKALDNYNKLDLDIYRGITSLNYGNLLVEQKKFREAIPQYQNAMLLVTMDQNKVLHAASEGGKGIAYLNINGLSEAQTAFERSIEISKEVGHIEQLKLSLEGLAQVQEKKGNYHQALILYKEYSAVKDTFFHQQQNQSLVDATEKYEAAEKEAQIIELNSTNEISQIRLSNSRKLLFASLFGILLFSALAYYLFNLNKTVRLQNNVISKALKEKDILLREIHHRVKNNMQFISSLLSLQSDYVLDPLAKSALHKGEHRVQSMALIHQNLYQEDHLTGIKTPEYFKKLTENLFESYNIHEDKIELHTDIDDVIIDVDTMVPLGLIVNELISNSLKHGFPEGILGNIYLSLKEVNNKLILNVKDDGIGLKPQELDKLKKSFGYKLIDAFTDQLDAEMTTDFEHGFEVTIRIEDYKKFAA